MPIDWDQRFIDLVLELPAVRAAGSSPGVLDRLVALLRRQVGALAVSVVRQVDWVTAQVVASEPANAPGAPGDLHRLRRLIDEAEVVLEPAGAAGPEASMTAWLPAAAEGFRGLFRLLLPAGRADEPGFARFLGRLRTMLDEEVRLVQVQRETGELGGRYRAILGTIPQGVVYISDNCRQTWMNPQAAELLRLGPDCQEPALISSALTRLRRTAANAAEIEHTGAELFRTPDGSIRGWRWVFGDPVARVLNVDSGPVRTEEGGGRLWVFTDLTAEHQATAELARLNAELAESESLFRVAFESSATGMGLVGPDARLTRVNRAFCDLLGYTMEELQGRPVLDITPPEEREASLVMGARLWGGEVEQLHHEKPYQHRDGHRVWTVLSASMVRDAEGRPAYLFGQFQDISARRAAEARLRAHEALLATILDALPVPTFVKDLEGRYTLANAAFAARRGLSAGAILGRTDHELFPQFAARNSDQDAQVLAGDGPTEWLLEVDTVQGPRQVIVRKVALRGPDARPIGVLGVSTDITERKQAETELILSRARYQTVVDDLTEMVCRYRPDGTMTFINDAFCDFYGVTREQLINHHWSPVVHPDDVERVRSEVARVGVDCPTVRITSRTANTRGQTRWVEYINRALLDPGGRVVEIQAVGRDVTAQREHELQLESINSRLRLANAAGSIGTWTWNFADDSLEWDERLIEWYGVPDELRRSGITYAFWQSRIHPEDLERVEAVASAARYDGGKLDYEFRVVRADGVARVIHCSGVVEADLEGRPFRMVGINRDITAQREQEDQLRSINQRLELATQAGSIGTWSWTLADRTLQWDRALMDWFGVPEPDRAARISYEYLRSRMHPEDLEPTEAALADALENDIPFRHETRLFRADGALRVIHASALIERDAEGRPIRMIGINRDVTEQRELERSLAQTRAQAESANEAKSRFLAHMSHEIRTPAGAIIGYADMLLDPRLDREGTVASVQAIRRNGAHLLRILDDVLDLAKVEAGKVVLEEHEYSPWQLIAEMRSLLQVRADERSIQLECRAITTLPDRVLIDPTRLRQVLINLVGNALKFSEPGRAVEVSIAAEAGDCDRPGTLILAVADQGIGMTAEQLGRLFRPFEQADGSMTRRFGGTGLGLSITQGLVAVMGGSISVQSTPEVGSRFTVRIPLRLPAGALARWIEPGNLTAVPVTQQAWTDPGGRLDPSARILLVDDSPDNLRVIRFYLGRLGLERVATEIDGQAAVTAALRDRPDLVLLDMELPTLDGYAAARALRRSGFDRPIIALTAHAMQQDRDRSLEAGCDEHLTKPIDVTSLAVALARFLPPAAASPPAARPDPAPEPSSTTQADPIAPDFEGDDEFLTLVREYVAGLSPLFDDLAEALVQGDLGRAAERAHQLRGGGGMYGYPALTASAGRLEDAIRTGQVPERVSILAAELVDLLPRIVRGLERFG